ncbi:MAG: hypothetical protein NTV81_02250 [Candidatus Komeilibacteria bacterium]|nr:hypothetical protein [Candidatus Komeilibacteria bacterium]
MQKFFGILIIGIILVISVVAKIRYFFFNEPELDTLTLLALGAGVAFLIAAMLKGVPKAIAEATGAGLVMAFSHKVGVPLVFNTVAAIVCLVVAGGFELMRSRNKGRSKSERIANWLSYAARGSAVLSFAPISIGILLVSFFKF